VIATSDNRITPIAGIAARQMVCVRGEVTRMTLRPTGKLPSLAVSVHDGTGSITVVWTGRRSIGGISLGRQLLVRGVARAAGDHLEVMNPDYQLLPAVAEHRLRA
jgi:RecG-like helicase